MVKLLLLTRLIFVHPNHITYFEYIYSYFIYNIKQYSIINGFKYLLISNKCLLINVAES